MLVVAHAQVMWKWLKKHLLINKYLDLAKREPGELSLQERESLPTYYPKKGYGEIANKIGKKIENMGGKIEKPLNAIGQI